MVHRDSLEADELELEVRPSCKRIEICLLMRNVGSDQHRVHARKVEVIPVDDNTIHVQLECVRDGEILIEWKSPWSLRRRIVFRAARI